MDTTSKPFWTSKTLIFNVLSFSWNFIGPKIGIPTLDPETFGAFVLAANVVLRLLTKGAVSIS